MAGLLSLGMLSASAQTQGDVRLGVTGGMNVSNITDLEADCRIGFNLGARVDYGFTDNVYISSGLLLTQKGFKFEESAEGLKYEEKGNPLYLQIPIHIGYHHDLGNGVGFFGETGPYLAFGIAGKLKAVGALDVYEAEEKVDFFGNDLGKVFDMGWGLRAGVSVQQFQIHLGYEYGLTKVIEDTSCHNSNFTVGLSYFF